MDILNAVQDAYNVPEVERVAPRKGSVSVRFTTITTTKLEPVVVARYAIATARPGPDVAMLMGDVSLQESEKNQVTAVEEGTVVRAT